MEGWISVLIGSAVGQNETAELPHNHRANLRRKEQEFGYPWKGGGFAGIRVQKKEGKNCKGVLGKEEMSGEWVAGFWGGGVKEQMLRKDIGTSG
jgi:hypothetical protein